MTKYDFRHGWGRFWRVVGNIIKSLLTSPDGESYSPGRVMALILFGVGIIGYSAFWHQQLTLNRSVADWALIQQFSIVYLGGLAAICVGLILGQAPTDSGGAWWKGHGPPSPTENKTEQKDEK